MIPPGRRVLARTVVLFNTIPSKQLITRGSRRVTLLHLTVLQEETVNQMIKLHDSAEETRLVSPFFHGIVFLFFLGGFNRYPHHFFSYCCCNYCLIQLNHILPIWHLSFRHGNKIMFINMFSPFLSLYVQSLSDLISITPGTGGNRDQPKSLKLFGFLTHITEQK